jgi:sulfopyruvate decarboxylase subunit alpha
VKESSALLLVKEMKAAGIDFVTTLPDSAFREVYFMVKDDPFFQFVPVTNEGEGAAIAAGAWLGGKKPVLMMENSGIRVASEALARLSITVGVPVLMLMSYRGCLGDGNFWAINHGIVMEPMLKALRIPYCIIEKEEDIQGSIQRGLRTLYASMNHVAIVMGGGTLW